MASGSRTLAIAPTARATSSSTRSASGSARALPERANVGLVLDHSVEEVIAIHAPVFCARGWLDEVEAELLTQLWPRKGFKGSLYIRLLTPPEVVIERVVASQREADCLPEIEYLNEVARALLFSRRL